MKQKNIIFVTLVVVAVGAVFVNELIVQGADSESNREVASSSERYRPEQIKWEQELARTISRETNSQTILAAQPSLSEKFLYEALEGRYEAQVVNGKILKITLMPNREALNIDVNSVIKKYSSVFKEAKGFNRQLAEANTETINLIGADAQSIGRVIVLRNAQGLLTSLEIQ